MPRLHGHLGGTSALAASVAVAIVVALLGFPGLLGGEATPAPAGTEEQELERAALPEPGSTEGPAEPSAIRWQRSRAIGRAFDGRLVRGVRLPGEGEHYFTWDPIRRSSPNRAWRRFGTDRLVRIVLNVIREFRLAHPDAPRIGIGDLSRPHGGDFGPRFGPPGHASHQNGLDVDIYYPRRDGIERPPTRPQSIDGLLAQNLVDRFVGAGAQFVFVGFRVGLRGPRRIVQRIPHHENHLHVRIHNWRR